jgi:hypothetical protein
MPACCRSWPPRPAVTVEVERRLVDLFARSFPGLSVAAIGRELHAGGLDAHTPIGSLGRHLRSSFAAFPRRQQGYLLPDPVRAAALRGRLKDDGRAVVGLSWRSQNPKFEKAKSARLADFESVLRLPGCRLDLQYGDTRAEREAERNSACGIDRPDDADNTRDIDGLAAPMSAATRS